MSAPRRAATRRFPSSLGACFAAGALGAAAAVFVAPAFSAEAAPRKLAEGPPKIAPKDFLAPPPEDATVVQGVRMMANTRMRLDYRYNFKSQAQGPNKVDAWVDAFEVDAVFDDAQSWWDEKAPPALLDHEQGHVDLGWIAALELRREVRLEARRGRMKVTAASQPEAEKLLKKKIEAAVAPYFARHDAAHREYDATTIHGTRGDKQAEARRAQAKRLNDLLNEAKAGK